jgi:hypothetical protein
MVALALGAGAANRTVAAQQAPSRNALLSRTAALAAPRAAPPLDAWERRTRLVSLNSGALPSRAPAGQTPAASSEITIDLFDGASVTAVFDRFDPNDSGVTWIGHVPAYPESRVTLVQGGGMLAASIILPDASYTIRPVPLDQVDPAATSAPLHVLAQVNGDGFPREAAPLIPEATAASPDSAADVVMADTAEFIDVLIVYTALAETWSGGPAGMVNWINLAISETNSAYASSGVNQRVRLVHTDRVAYTEVPAFSTNLTNLRGGLAGLSNVPALRDAYTADLVSMFVRPTLPDACGIGFLMTTVSTAFAPSGYSVVYSPCASPNGTLAHEFGHNMGLRHDWYMDRGITPSTYAHGYVSLAGRFRTIMSYPDACSAQQVNCARLLSFSNPDLTHLGQPMGIPGGTDASCPTGNALNMSCDADERRALNDTAFAVANFRQFSELRPPLIRTHPQNRSVPRGQPLTLQVVAEGLGPLTYQWYRGSAPITAQPIPGANGPTYTFVPGADGVWFERWFYWVQVRNSIGPANSLTATVTMLPPGASPGASQLTAPQRAGGTRDSGRISTTANRTPYTAGARTPAEVPDLPATPAVTIGQPSSAQPARAHPSTAQPGIAEPGRAAPRELLPLPDQDDEDLRCRAAEVDAVVAWSGVWRSASQTTTLTKALAELMRALAALEDSGCRSRGGIRP